MALQVQDQSADINKAKRIARTAETIIRKCVKGDFRISKNEFTYASTIINWVDRYKTTCYPLGLADERIVDYLLYQIYRYRDSISTSQWNINWLFTDYAVSKYRLQFLTKEGKHGILYYINEWMEDNSLTKERLMNIIIPPRQHPMMKYIYMPSEEYVKRRWHNTEQGYLLCQSSTTGWAPLSGNCQSCCNAERCRAVTSKKYPELIRLREENM